MKLDKFNTVSRASVKIGNSFYTFEFGGEWFLEEGDDVNKCKKSAWDTCHTEVDKQIDEVVRLNKQVN